jgi:hypothetical protein
MNGLRELQRDFSGFIWGRQTECGHRIVSNGFEPDQRLAIYRNNTLLGLTQALRDVYPVIAILVGRDFFNRLCRDYIRRYPPNTGCLQTFGERFPEFLDAFQETSGLPCLPDTARLEWLRHEVYFESDQACIDPSSLAEVPPECYGKLRFSLHPSVRFLSSGYPVLRIWQCNQADPAEEVAVDLESGGCRLLIFRYGWQVEMWTLEPGEYRFMTGLQAGRTLIEAASEVLRDDPEFDLTTLLRICLSRPLFSEYFLH